MRQTSCKGLWKDSKYSIPYIRITNLLSTRNISRESIGSQDLSRWEKMRR